MAAELRHQKTRVRAEEAELEGDKETEQKKTRTEGQGGTRRGSDCSTRDLEGDGA